MIADPARSLHILLLLVVLTLLSACRPPAPQPRPALDAAALLAGVEASAELRRGLRARARLAIDAPDLRVSRPQRIAAQRPATLRVEILGLFNQVAAVLVVHDGVYQLWESGASDIQEGPVTPALLWRIARVALAPEEAVDLLLGAPRPDPTLALGRAGWGPARFDVERVDAGGALRERVSFDAEGRLRGFERFDPTGALVWSATFDDHRPLMGGDGAMQSFAHVVQLRFPSEGARVDVEYRNVQLDPELAPSLFRLGAGPRPGDARLAAGAAAR